ncbi:MAG TPA: molybdopterin cofactor-binding domain-containing protein [Pseudomonadales bacterium]
MGKWTRRALITAGVVGGGALLVGVAIRPGNRAGKLAPLVAQGDESLIGAWVKIGADNRVTAIVPHSEMGQGAQTALAQMLADELDARWDDVAVMEAPALDEYANYMLGKGFLLGPAEVPRVLIGTLDGALMQVAKAMHLQITGGSLSVRATGQYGMRVAGAAARELLVRAAADAWSVPAAELTTAEGRIVHARTSRSAPYADFAAAAGQLTPPYSPALKRPEDFTIIGRSVARLDIPDKVNGSARFGIDATVPGLKVAAIRQAPVFGAQLASVDDGAARSMPGVADVVRLTDAVAVVADGFWQASQALAAVEVRWTEPAQAQVDQAGIFAQFDADMATAVADGNEKIDVSHGDVAAAFAEAVTSVEATYRVPYLAHACMEPMNATVAIDGDACQVWIGSQNPLGTRHSVAAALDLDPDKVTVHNHVMGGGFGRRSIDDAAVQAALVARAVGAPVKLIWSREEDVRRDHYRPAVTSRFKAGLDGQGLPLAWENQYVDKHEPAEAPHIPYAVANQRIHYADSPTHVPFGAWRSVDHSQHGFFTESFIDELAHAAGRDPYEYRRALLSQAPRHRRVLETAAEKAGWADPLGAGRGRGISLQASFGSIVAQVVDVTVDGGSVRVDRVVCAVDPGFAVSPDGLAAQMESGILYGLTAALYGDIRIHAGAVSQSNFHDYQMVRMAEAPQIDVHILASDNPPGGAGEPGTPGIGPALTNAIFAATGTRIRQLPVSQYDLSYAVEEPVEVI